MTDLLNSIAYHASRNPDAPAVADHQQRWTYRQLWRTASSIATAIHPTALGEARTVLVAVEPGVHWVASLLGIWRAGAVAVPLDLGQPPARLAALALQCRATRAITLTGQPPPWAPTIDSTAAEVITADDSDRRPSTAPGRVACVYATSGSTGRPKPVLVSHVGLTARIHAIAEIYGLTGTDRIAQLTSPAFDTTLWEVLPILTRGGQLLIPFGPDRVAGPELATWLAHHRITAFTCTPTVLSALPFTNLPALRLIVLGGEPLRPGPLDRWLGRYRVANAYGPTESTIEAFVASAVRPGQQPIPIGRPFPDVHARIVNPVDRTLVTDTGRIGELYLAGTGLALGYLGMPDETTAAFPVLDLGAGARRYFRTGDLVARMPDGQLTYIGRADRQLNLGGVRVEPGEIETCASGFTGVRAAAVTAATRVDGHQILTLHAATDGTVTEADLRRHMTDHLMAVAVPTRVRLVDHLPQTSSGKVDHATLASLSTEPTGAAPSPPAEVPRRVLQWWQELAATRGEPDFFLAGGSSIAAIRLVSLINQDYGTALTIADFLADPTLHHLARVLAGTPGQRQDHP